MYESSSTCFRKNILKVLDQTICCGCLSSDRNLEELGEYSELFFTLLKRQKRNEV